MAALDLRATGLGDAGAAALSHALTFTGGLGHSTLEDLKLAHNRIGDLGAQALAQVLKARAALTSLNLIDNQAGAPVLMKQGVGI